jgi:hypothetical protein
VRARNLLEAISRISSEFGVPAGIEWSDPLNVERPIHLERTNVTLEQILRDVVALDPLYEFSISADVVHVRPLGFATRPDNYLNAVVPSFVAKDLYTVSASNKLRAQLHSMFSPRLAEPARRACGGSVAVGALEVKTSIDLQNATARSILDGILVDSEYSMWLAVFKSGLNKNGMLTSASIWREGVKTGQPDWAFIPRFFNPVEHKERMDWRIRATTRAP